MARAARRAGQVDQDRHPVLVLDVQDVVVHRGDGDAGAVLLKINRLGDGCEVLTRFRGLDGEPGWLRGTGPDPVDEGEADDYVQRQMDRDPDVWVIEIEDPKDRYRLDGPIM